MTATHTQNDSSLTFTGRTGPLAVIRREQPKVDQSGDWMLGGFFLLVLAVLALIPILF